MFNSLQPCGLQYTRLPCPSFYPGVCSNSWPLSQWCYPTISSSATPFSSCPQSFPASGSFPMSQFFTSGGQGIGASASASVVPINSQGWFPLELASHFFFKLHILSIHLFATPHSLWDLSSPTRDWTWALSSESAEF